MINNIMIVGVGGQGTLLASKILGRLFVDRGYDVRVSEVHGMSQRGGSVVTYVRRGERVASPLICEGEADLILAFEELEAARYLPYLKTGGIVIASRQRIEPAAVLTGASVYPPDIGDRVKKSGAILYEIDALEAAIEAGSPKAVNLVLLGVLSRMLPEIEPASWTKVIAQTVPPRFLEINERAFAAGRNMAIG